MTRLTNDVRDAITLRAVTESFAARDEAIKQAEDQLAREAYALLFSEAETKAVAKVPENWFRRDQCLRFNAGGYSVRLSLIGEGLPVPYRAAGSDDGGYYCHTLGSIPAGDLCDRIQAHATAVEALKRERGTAHRSVRTMLSGVTTIKQLRAAWPEGEPFFKPYEDAPAAALPAVRVDEVNALLGLAA